MGIAPGYERHGEFRQTALCHTNTSSLLLEIVNASKSISCMGRGHEERARPSGTCVGIWNNI